LGKSATQSSDYGGQGLASAAVDGNIDAYFENGSVTQTSVEADPWWQVDLGEHYNINQIVLWNRNGCCLKRLINFYVFVSDTDLTGRPLTDLVIDASVWRYYSLGVAPLTLPIDVNRGVRYVRVQIVGEAALSLAEVQITGLPAAVGSQSLDTTKLSDASNTVVDDNSNGYNGTDQNSAQ